MKKNRNRFVYGILIISVILLGLASRKISYILPELMKNYAGDTLWALMIFLGFGFIFKRLSTRSIGISALIFSFFIEISQLYHAPWIDEIRKTTLGGLVLGFGFLWSDLICYVVGVMIGVVIEKFIIKIN